MVLLAVLAELLNLTRRVGWHSVAINAVSAGNPGPGTGGDEVSVSIF
jgi:hypothetical protein